MTGGIKNIGAKIVRYAAQDLFATVVLIAANVRNKNILMAKIYNITEKWLEGE
jgi:hypothetical protein